MRASSATTARSSRPGSCSTPRTRRTRSSARASTSRCATTTPMRRRSTLANDDLRRRGRPVEPADRAAAPEGRTELRRRHRPQRRLAQPRRQLGPGRDRRPAERGAGRAGDPRGTRARAPRRLHGEGSRGREERPPAGAARQPLAGRHRGRRVGRQSRPRPHLRVLAAVRGSPEGADARRGQRRVPQVHRARPHDLRDRRRREEGDQAVGYGDFRHRMPLRVRWAEVDRQGVVFNAHYLLYADVCATEYWRAVGMRYPVGLRAARVGPLRPQGDRRLPRGSALRRRARSLRARRPHRRDQPAVQRRDVPPRPAEAPLVAVDLVYVYVDAATKTPRRVDDVLRAKIRAFETVAPDESSSDAR